MTKQVVATLIAYFSLSFFAFGQAAIEEGAFRSMTPEQRQSVLFDFPFERLDSAALAEIFPPLLGIAAEKNDLKTQFVLRYLWFRNRRTLKMPPAKTLQELTDLQLFAASNNWPVEQTVAMIYRAFEEHDQKAVPFEQIYVKILQCCHDLQATGLDAFIHYRPDLLLRYLGRFFYDMDDLEQALFYLKLSEQYLDEKEENTRNILLVLNNIQTIYQKQKNYPTAIAYAKKILDFTQKNDSDKPEIQTLKKLWAGIATIDMASMMVEQKRFAEGEVLADQGYRTFSAQTNDFTFNQAEYDVLQVLIPIKLELKKLGEAQKLLQRTEQLNRILDQAQKPDPFKHIRFYQNYAQFYELTGNYSEAFHYFKKAQILADSLDRQTDAHKFEKIQQRLAAQHYTEQIQLIEKEKRLLLWLRNAAILILLLVVGLAWVNFRRLQAKRQFALVELDAARKDLHTYTQGFREKSELAENLRLEMEERSNRGEHSQYLEQLTQSTILTDADWGKFKNVFEKVYPSFIAEQKQLFPDLTQAELRYLVLEKLSLNTHEMANMLGVSDGTIRQTRSRLRKKTGRG